MDTKRRSLFAPLLLLALLALFSSQQTFVRAADGDGTPSLGVAGTRIQASQTIDQGSVRRGAAQDYSEQVRARNQQTRGRGQSTQPRQQPGPSTVARPNNQRRQREASVPVRQNPVRVPVTTTRTRTRTTTNNVNIPTRPNNVNIPTRPNNVVRNPRSGVNFANTVNTATQVGQAQKAFKIRKITMPSEFQSLRLPKATYGYELEGYHTDIFKFIKPKRPTPAQKNYDSWTPQQRAENYLTKAVPKAKFNLGDIDIPLMKKRLTTTDPGQFGDYEPKAATEFPFNQWEKIYTELNDNAMWEIVSLPFDGLNEMFRNLIDTMQKTGQKDRFYRVQINVFTDEIPQENWEKLVSLVASSNFALAFAGREAAVRHSSNHYPSAEDFHGTSNDQSEEAGGLYDNSSPGMYDRPFDKMTGAYKLRLVAIRTPPSPDTNKKMVRIEFRAVPNQKFGDCMIRNFLASAITSDNKVNTFGECMNAETKKCSEASVGLKTPTVSEVKEWSKQFPPNLDNVVSYAQYNDVVKREALKKVVVAHPAWGTSTAADSLSTKDTAGTLVPYVQCLLVAAAKSK